ncbi:MAG: cofactor-independent phosphoglycerate mutase, partial [Actinobacteria bacterium]
MKYAIVILDGASGWPFEDHGGLTSLQRADTPNLDRMAAEGLVGLAHTVPEGEEPSSAAACMSILGYDPSAVRIGRGAIEAASLGIALADDEVALRLNTVTIADGVMRSYAAGHITTAESHALVAELAAALGDETFRFHPGVAYRHIVVVKGHPELMECAYTPPHDISDRPVAARTPRGAGAELLLDLMD